MNKKKIAYFIRSVARYFSPRVCTNCGSTESSQVDRKYLVTQLFECNHCKLQFRHPVDSKVFNNSFYQEDYEQADGITTDLPDSDELQSMINSDFKDSAKNVDDFIRIFDALIKTESYKLIDYGSSWGYMSYQFKKKGISTQSFEISKPRASYGNKHLGLNIATKEKELDTNNDVFFSSHVIEHVPSINGMVDLAKKLLLDSGFFVAESPNGSGAYRKKDPLGFHKGWGLVHPNYLSGEFYEVQFQNNPYLILSSPYDFSMIRNWDQKSQLKGKLDGDQLLIISMPNFSMSRDL